MSPYFVKSSLPKSQYKRAWSITTTVHRAIESTNAPSKQLRVVDLQSQLSEKICISSRWKGDSPSEDCAGSSTPSTVLPTREEGIVLHRSSRRD